MDIALVFASTLLFSLQFVFQQRYQKARGDSIASAVDFSLYTSFVGLLVVLCFAGFCPTFTPGAFLIAGASAIVELLFVYCGNVALHFVNLSVYSVFAMLGGMLLPSLYGILFAGEPMTWQKGVCFTLVLAAVVLTRQKEGGSRFAFLFYGAVFVLNGMSGVLAKIHGDAAFAVDSASYLVWSKAVGIALCLVLRLLFYRGIHPLTLPVAGYSGGYALFTTFGNFFLLIALQTLPASVQYPLVTGGVMAISTAVSLICREKVTARQLISAVLALLSTIVIIL